MKSDALCEVIVDWQKFKVHQIIISASSFFFNFFLGNLKLDGVGPNDNRPSTD